MTKPVTLDLEQGHTLLLKGPAWIRAKRGDAQCFGAPIQSDDWTMIEESRQEPIYAADNTLCFVPDKVVDLATRLKNRMTRSADTVLVNTDGWLTEFNALRHKQLLLEELQPDLVRWAESIRRYH